MEFYGINFDALTLDQLLNAIEEQIAMGATKRVISTVNTDILLMSRDNIILRKSIQDSWVRTADGMPLIWISKLLGRPLPERVTGADLSRELCLQSSSRVYFPFLFGASPGVAELAWEKVLDIEQSARIAGTYSPTREELLSADSSRELVRMINESNANILLLALGTPLQEEWMNKYLEDLNVSVLIGVGASLDFLSGTIKRAPIWMQRTGLEWLFRLLHEPNRLWRRYSRDFLIFPLFLSHIIRGEIK